MRHTTEYTLVRTGQRIRATWWQVGNHIFRHRATTTGDSSGTT